MPSLSVQFLDLQPNNYMMLIYNLTKDETKSSREEERIQTKLGQDFIQTEQVLTEYGICYMTNNLLLNNLSTS